MGSKFIPNYQGSDQVILLYYHANKNNLLNKVTDTQTLLKNYEREKTV